jgi:hypothetical protein
MYICISVSMRTFFSEKPCTGALVRAMMPSVTLQADRERCTFLQPLMVRACSQCAGETN